MRKAMRFSFPNKLASQLRDESSRTFLICSMSFGVILLSCLLSSPPLPFDTCLFKIITGLPCPSCGMTHAFISLGHRHFQEAFFYNLMGPFVYFALVIVLFISIYGSIFRRPLLSVLWKKYQRRVFAAVLFLAFISWVWNIYKTV